MTDRFGEKHESREREEPHEIEVAEVVPDVEGEGEDEDVFLRWEKKDEKDKTDTERLKEELFKEGKSEGREDHGVFVELELLNRFIGELDVMKKDLGAEIISLEKRISILEGEASQIESEELRADILSVAHAMNDLLAEMVKNKIVKREFMFFGDVINREGVVVALGELEEIMAEVLAKHN